ncbi:unnamed protein product [Trichogramma brassicae]|uniref:Uncharacterized protein n=1 Tax=Trichogramma brassicae TaxID=86971 RepID=A0A6H5IM51_9HYME|nr:unnamed protein product [Trichogramma brassicae]
MKINAEAMRASWYSKYQQDIVPFIITFDSSIENLSSGAIYANAKKRERRERQLVKEYELYTQTILHRINKEMVENDQLYQFISDRSNGHSCYKKAINALHEGREKEGSSRRESESLDKKRVERSSKSPRGLWTLCIIFHPRQSEPIVRLPFQEIANARISRASKSGHKRACRKRNAITLTRSSEPSPSSRTHPEEQAQDPTTPDMTIVGEGERARVCRFNDVDDSRSHQMNFTATGHSQHMCLTRHYTHSVHTACVEKRCMDNSMYVAKRERDDFIDVPQSTAQLNEKGLKKSPCRAAEIGHSEGEKKTMLAESFCAAQASRKRATRSSCTAISEVRACCVHLTINRSFKFNWLESLRVAVGEEKESPRLHGAKKGKKGDEVEEEDGARGIHNKRSFIMFTRRVGIFVCVTLLRLRAHARVQYTVAQPAPRLSQRNTQRKKVSHRLYRHLIKNFFEYFTQVGTLSRQRRRKARRERKGVAAGVRSAICYYFTVALRLSAASPKRDRFYQMPDDVKNLVKKVILTFAVRGALKEQEKIRHCLRGALPGAWAVFDKSVCLTMQKCELRKHKCIHGT